MEIYIGFLISFAVLIMAFSGFVIGFKTGKNIACTNDIPLTFPTVSASKETDEQRRTRILTENIENYGTDIPQKEVM